MPDLTASALDQGLLSGANLAYNILLARWFAASAEGVGEYGAFSIVYSIYLFAYGLHAALILEPMAVFGAGKYHARYQQYLESLMTVQVAFLVIPFLAIGGVIFFSKSNLSLNTIAGACLVAPLMMIFGFVRRACYTLTRPDWAVRGSLVHAVALGMGALIMVRFDLISGFFAFLTLGVASIAGILVVAPVVGIRSRLRLTRWDGLILWRHWRFGKWLLASSILYWASDSIYLPLIGYWAGLEEAGIFKALRNIIFPLNQVVSAFSLLFLPIAAGIWHQDGIIALTKWIKRIIYMFVFMTIIYILFVLFYGDFLITILYSNDVYKNYDWILVFLGAAAILESLKQGTSISLTAMEQTRLIFRTRIAGVIVTLVIGIALLYWMGLRGAVWGYVVSVFTVTLMSVLYAKRTMNNVAP
ncbi:MAG: hypothetical protein KatS3mg043_1728 [Rhodothermaceae bacterium]|nr:MAG: hypothetical protein KatS3mg043_1728 [Rhodothermaceae bacterium]